MNLDTGNILRIVLAVGGVIMLVQSIGSLARRRMHESFCLAWGIISVAVFLAGILLRPSQLHTYISKTGLILIFVILFGTLYAGYFVSLKISELIRKNQELAIQVSLLIHENNEIKSRLEESEQNKDSF